MKPRMVRLGYKIHTFVKERAWYKTSKLCNCLGTTKNRGNICSEHIKASCCLCEGHRWLFCTESSLPNKNISALQQEYKPETERQTVHANKQRVVPRCPQFGLNCRRPRMLNNVKASHLGITAGTKRKGLTFPTVPVKGKLAFPLYILNRPFTYHSYKKKVVQK